MNAFPSRAVLPSLMSADLLRLGDQVEALLDAGARVFHIDVMDGRFVPNLTLGTGFAQQLAPLVRGAGGFLDVHLMVERPGHLIDMFAPHAGAISVHAEADPHVHRLLGQIREHGCLAGLAVNPATPLAVVETVVDMLDYVNVMCINPGFAGQPFLETTPERVARLQQVLPPEIHIQVDGGIGPATLHSVRDAGATLFVSASAIFGADDPIAMYTLLAGEVA